MEPNRKLFPGHLSFILHGTLLGADCLQCGEGIQFPVLRPGVQGEVFVVWSLDLSSHLFCWNQQKNPTLELVFQTQNYNCENTFLKIGAGFKSKKVEFFL
jgi:hypothetical protein